MPSWGERPHMLERRAVATLRHLRGAKYRPLAADGTTLQVWWLSRTLR